MSVAFTDGVEAIARFVVNTAISERARQRASIAVIDTCGVMLAGAGEPAARIAQSMAAEDGVGECRVVGTSIATSPTLAAFANGVAAHALDYDDMCFVSLAHPSVRWCRRFSPRARSRTRRRTRCSTRMSSASRSNAGSGAS